jgi:two-component system, LuxR family, response regulator FixJ
MEQQPNPAVQVAVVGIVDDDPAVRNSLKFSLEVEGYAVGIYASADELLQDRELGRLCCLVIDQHLPGLSGLDLVGRLRERQIPVPVILITSHSPRALISRAAQSGVPIVEKPLLGNALLDKIHDLVGSRAASGLESP